jgi:hypothetical protein
MLGFRYVDPPSGIRNDPSLPPNQRGHDSYWFDPSENRRTGIPMNFAECLFDRETVTAVEALLNDHREISADRIESVPRSLATRVRNNYSF